MVFLSLLKGFSFLAELWWPKGLPSEAPWPFRKVRKPMNLFPVVIMASGIAHGRVRTATMTTAVAIQQLIG